MERGLIGYETRIRKDGNSYVVTLPKEELQKYGVVPGDSVIITCMEAGSIILWGKDLPIGEDQRTNYHY